MTNKITSNTETLDNIILDLTYLLELTKEPSLQKKQYEWLKIHFLNSHSLNIELEKFTTILEQFKKKISAKDIETSNLKDILADILSERNLHVNTLLKNSFTIEQDTLNLGLNIHPNNGALPIISKYIMFKDNSSKLKEVVNSYDHAKAEFDNFSKELYNQPKDVEYDFNVVTKKLNLIKKSMTEKQLALKEINNIFKKEPFFAVMESFLEEVNLKDEKKTTLKV